MGKYELLYKDVNGTVHKQGLFDNVFDAITKAKQLTWNDVECGDYMSVQEPTIELMVLVREDERGKKYEDVALPIVYMRSFVIPANANVR